MHDNSGNFSAWYQSGEAPDFQGRLRKSFIQKIFIICAFKGHGWDQLLQQELSQYGQCQLKVTKVNSWLFYFLGASLGAIYIVLIQHFSETDYILLFFGLFILNDLLRFSKASVVLSINNSLNRFLSQYKIKATLALCTNTILPPLPQHK